MISLFKKFSLMSDNIKNHSVQRLRRRNHCNVVRDKSIYLPNFKICRFARHLLIFKLQLFSLVPHQARSRLEKHEKGLPVSVLQSRWESITAQTKGYHGCDSLLNIKYYVLISSSISNFSKSSCPICSFLFLLILYSLP